MRKINDLNEQEICNDYLNNNIGMDRMAAKYHVGKSKIRDILYKNNIQIKKRGGQFQLENLIINDWRIKKYPPIEGKHYVIVDKKDNFTTTDIDNLSGILTTHIEKEYGIQTPTLYYRRKYYMETGNYWWEQWLDVTTVEDSPTKKCPYCEWETIDINNRSGMFETHLSKCHNLSKNDYLLEHPEDKSYFTTVNPMTDRQMEMDKNKFTICKVCGRKLARITNHHLKMHGMTKMDYIMKYGSANLSSNEYHQKQSEASIITNMNMTFTKYSKAEIEIKDFLTENGLYCTSNRTILKGKEIDIFVPSKNIGIEYNGNKWHTEWFGKKDKNYHLSKMEECHNKNIGLISIFEDEYENHKEIVLSKIAHILNIEEKHKSKIYARKCEVREVYSYEAEDFLNRYHIQGFSRSTVFIGAFYKGELVGVMSFLNNGSDRWELSRFASNIKYICCGIGGKLFKYFTSHYEYSEIKSFADRRWTLNENNTIYNKLGFTFKGFIKPSYTYYNTSIDRLKRFHKFNFRKNILLRRHPELDPRMTETEMAKTLGYDRIWDCGLIKYVYTNPNKSR